MSATWKALKTCPRWDACSAPICPLDPDWRLRAGEPVCFYLREAVKNGVDQARFEAGLAGHIYEPVLQALPEVRGRHEDIARQLETSAATGSRIEQWAAQKGKRPGGAASS